VHARKPHLQNVLVRRRIKQVLAEKSPALVDGHGMPDDTDIGISRGVGKLDRVVDPPNGTHGVPNAHKMDFAIPRKGFLEIRENTEINMALFDHSDRIGNQCFIASREESNSVEHPTKRSGGVCTPAEAKDINPIFRFIISHQKLIGVRYIVRNPVAKR